MVVCGLRMVAGLSIAKSQWELFPEMVLGPRVHQELGFVQTWMLALRPAFSKASRIPTTTHTHTEPRLETKVSHSTGTSVPGITWWPLPHERLGGAQWIYSQFPCLLFLPFSENSRTFLFGV